jgi:uncharacterized protein (UPF0335 family)
MKKQIIKKLGTCGYDGKSIEKILRLYDVK